MPYVDPEKEKAYRKRFYHENRDKARAASLAYYYAHSDEMRKKRRIRHIKTRDIALRQMAEYRKLNSDRIQKSKAKWYARSDVKERLQKKFFNRYYSEPCFRLGSTLRVRVRRAVKAQAGQKAFKTIQLIGCNIESLRQHLESMFKRGMSWTNYGRSWHIDHIIPCAAFDLTDPRQQRQCFHFTNLRPLSAKANIRKSAKITDPQLALLI